MRNALPQGEHAATEVQVRGATDELLATACPLSLAFVLRLAAAANQGDVSYLDLFRTTTPNSEDETKKQKVENPTGSSAPSVWRWERHKGNLSIPLATNTTAARAIQPHPITIDRRIVPAALPTPQGLRPIKDCDRRFDLTSNSTPDLLRTSTLPPDFYPDAMFRNSRQLLLRSQSQLLHGSHRRSLRSRRS
jgi:hypothetical protein